jgi:hypothetical protein
LVEALLGAGFTVLPINPELVARRRGPARKKDDPEDAASAACWPSTRTAVCARWWRTARSPTSCARSPVTTPAPPATSAGCWNRLRRDLLAVFPAAMHISDGQDLNRVTLLRMLATWPTATQLATVDRAKLVALARAGKHRSPQRFADRVHAALTSPQLPVPDELARAKADTIRLTATHLLALHAQRRVWERRMGELLLGGPRSGRSRQPHHQAQQRAEGFPGGEIYLELSGPG